MSATDELKQILELFIICLYSELPENTGLVISKQTNKQATPETWYMLILNILLNYVSLKEMTGDRAGKVKADGQDESFSKYS